MMKKVNLGCGGFPFEGWINYDQINHIGVIKHDLSKGIPLGNNTVDLIFSEHFLEHLKRDEAIVLLKECYRVMIPGGRMRIVMPNLQAFVVLYEKGRIHRDPIALQLLKDIGLWESNNGSFCQFLNQAMRAWGHQFLWDSEEIFDALHEIGFNSVQYGKWPSEIFPGNRNMPTDLIVECVK